MDEVANKFIIVSNIILTIYRVDNNDYQIIRKKCCNKMIKKIMYKKKSCLCNICVKKIKGQDYN